VDLSDSPLSSISIMPVAGIPEVRSGDDISDLIVEHFVLRELDVVVGRRE
jgi:F420-0:gamma-glutamyl ligase